MSGPEFSPVKYTESEDCKYFQKITHKFNFKSEDVKCEMPVYDDEHPELFIELVNEYWNMAETYELFAGDKTLLFDRFRPLYLEFSRHSKNSTALSKQRKKVESQGTKGISNLKRHTSPNGKTLDSILSLTRKRGSSQKNLANFFIMETTIGKIASTNPIPITSKAKQGTGRKKRKVKRTEELEKK